MYVVRLGSKKLHTGSALRHMVKHDVIQPAIGGTMLFDPGMQCEIRHGLVVTTGPDDYTRLQETADCAAVDPGEWGWFNRQRPAAEGGDQPATRSRQNPKAVTNKGQQGPQWQPRMTECERSTNLGQQCLAVAHFMKMRGCMTGP